MSFFCAKVCHRSGCSLGSVVFWEVLGVVSLVWSYGHAHHMFFLSLVAIICIQVPMAFSPKLDFFL